MVPIRKYSNSFVQNTVCYENDRVVTNAMFWLIKYQSRCKSKKMHQFRFWTVHVLYFHHESRTKKYFLIKKKKMVYIFTDIYWSEDDMYRLLKLFSMNCILLCQLIALVLNLTCIFFLNNLIYPNDIKLKIQKRIV